MLYNEKRAPTVGAVYAQGLIHGQIRIHYIACATNNQFIHEK